MTASPTVAPAITVLMSCYNAARWLEKAINSVLNQTFKDFEFVIVDDGSKDKTLEIIQRYAERDMRIVIITKPNTGLADSLNLGIQKARGEWIARFDADDICEPTRLEKQIHLARAKPGLVFIGTGLTIMDQHGNLLNIHRYSSRHASLLKHLRAAQKFPPHSSAFYRAEAVRAIGGYRPRIRLSEDRDLWLRLSEMGKLACIAEPLVRIRKHSDQISHGGSGRRQKIDSQVAIVSYFLRQHGFVDPVGADETSFNMYWSWIEKQLEDEGLFALKDFGSQLKDEYYSASNSLVGVIKVFRAALKKPGIMLRFIWWRVVGDNFQERLVREWMRRTDIAS